MIHGETNFAKHNLKYVHWQHSPKTPDKFGYSCLQTRAKNVSNANPVPNSLPDRKHVSAAGRALS
jgi:hypothetical protein